MLEKVRYWVEEILECNRRDHTTAISTGDQRGPFRSARALAMAMMAMHDAHAGVTGATTPFRTPLPAVPDGANAEDAAAAAAVTVLRQLYPKQGPLLVAAWQSYQAIHGAAAPGIAFGEVVGRSYLGWRSGDEAFFGGAESYMPWESYDHGPDPLSPGQSFAGVLWGNAPPFLVPKQHLEPPPGSTPAGGPQTGLGPWGFEPGPFYAEEYAEAMAFGALNSVARSPEEEEIGIFWGYDGSEEIGTPPRLYMQVAMAVLATRGPLSASAYLDVLSTMACAMGDAGIQAWHYKYSPAHNLWRPVLGIRKAAARPETPRDPGWTPLGKPDTNTRKVGATPDFPSYPSGHATFGAAAFDVLRRWLRNRESLGFGNGDVDSIAFDFTSDEFNGRNTDPRDGLPRRVATRHHASLWQAIVENSESRIWLGVHWRMDGISRRGNGGETVHGRPARPSEVGAFGGVPLGLAIADAVAAQRGF